ncbi:MULTISPECIES: DUF3515 domain-containing protein [unclassified Nocardioides]|uniref:DUF3515 domain-containing protein n=1 Tax=unclassified Nocardioides TaxID=2615069 RepID=UPI0012980D69|nr:MULTISPECIES: DUF3515 domain-containing protein [unclassified Nocardioides]
MSLRARGVVASSLLPLALLAGCGGDAVEVDSPALADPSLSDAERATCTDFLDALPEDLAGLEPAEVDPADAPAKAWGDGLAVVCGVPEPEELAPAAECDIVAGVAWFVPPSQRDEGSDLIATAVETTPRVALVVPAEYRGQIAFDAFGELAEPVRTHLETTRRCS